MWTHSYQDHKIPGLMSQLISGYVITNQAALSSTVSPLCRNGFESDPKEGQERALNKQKASDRTSSHESHRIGACCTAKNIVCLYSTVCVGRTCGCLCSYMHKCVTLYSECDIYFVWVLHICRVHTDSFLLAAHMSRALICSLMNLVFKMPKFLQFGSQAKRD